MTGHDIPLEYANSIIHDLQKAFWDERGKGARFRVTTVGRDYFLDRCLPRITVREIEPIVQVIGEVLREEGIVADLSYDKEAQLLRLQVQGCLHQSVEQRLLARGVEPFACIPANLVVLAIEQALDRPVELAEVKIVDGTCHLLLICFDSRPTFD